MGCNIGSKYIDLHVHSTASDGTLTPLEVLDLALQSNLSAISLTDHDTIAGVLALSAAKIPPEIKFITGVEISCAPLPDFGHKGSIHMLGYRFNPDDRALNAMLAASRTARETRTPQILAKLDRLGIQIRSAELSAAFEHHTQFSRPHIAAVMVQKGYAQSVNDAFDRFLGTGQAAYVHRYRPSCREAIERVKAADGLPVLAHPGLLMDPRGAAFEQMIMDLKRFGLAGIEAYSPNHRPEEEQYYLSVAQRNNLLVTGGSDFHGKMHPEIFLGRGHGDLCVSFDVYEKLMAQP